MIDRRSVIRGLAALPLLGTAACSRAAAPGPLPDQAGEPITQERGLYTRLIPGAGEQVPVIGIGTARRYADPEGKEQLATLKQTVARFVELGGKMIDTAPSYGRAEEVIGQLVEELGVRDRLFLATKVGANSKEEGRAQIAQSFRNLRTSVIDLIAVHNLRDVTNQLATLRELKSAGKVRSIGATTSSRVGFAQSIDETNSSAALYADFEAMMRREPLDVIQIDYAIDNRGAGERILPLAQEQGLAVMINLPFGRGRLFEATKDRPLPDWATEIGAETWAQVFLKYVVSHPVRPIAIPGMARPHYVDDNIGAARGPLPDAAMRRRMEQFIDGL
ncbi:MAG TPA: aldo/keto reductase [Sphingomicrobium sp.]|nr:aldo/keto reductase [Sphingomicrobium sp.]